MLRSRVRALELVHLWTYITLSIDGGADTVCSTGWNAGTEDCMIIRNGVSGFGFGSFFLLPVVAGQASSASRGWIMTRGGVPS